MSDANFPRAENLDTRGTIQRPNETQDSAGQMIPDWQTVRTVWMQVIGGAGTEKQRGNQIEGTAPYTVWMRYRSDVSVQWRIKLGSRVLEILSAVDPDNRRTWLRCECSEVKT